MAKSVLGSFVSGTRQVLAVQLFISVGAVGLAGWTLGITNDLIRERDTLNTRVIQLEEELARNNIVPPPVVDQADVAPAPTETTYPPSTTLPEPVEERPADAPAPADQTPTPNDPPTRDPNTGATGGVRGDVTGERPTTAERAPFDVGVIFARPPALNTLVLHVRNGDVDDNARRLAAELERSAGVRVVIDEMQTNDRRENGYAYFDGRQGRAAAALVQQFNDAARRYEIAPWAVQLRGVALPAQGEYTAERVDIVLPPRPRVLLREPALIDRSRVERATPAPAPTPVR
ncbi:hypothetical protein U91I_01337 [alpha proteobacterium U9-1i]|nr:hypothetical protein U91I_01337 [alpha proteobacterium U9-1i]